MIGRAIIHFPVRAGEPFPVVWAGRALGVGGAQLLGVAACGMTGCAAGGGGGATALSLVQRDPRSFWGDSGDPSPRSTWEFLHEEAPDHRVIVAPPRDTFVGGENGRVFLRHPSWRTGRAGSQRRTSRRSGRRSANVTVGSAGGFAWTSGRAPLRWFVSSVMSRGQWLFVSVYALSRARPCDVVGQVQGRTASSRPRPAPGITRTPWARSGAHDLESHEVVRLVDPPRARARRRVEPLVADEHQHDVALVDLLADVLLEVRARRNGVEVHEHVGVGQAVAKAVVQSRSPPDWRVVFVGTR